MKRIPINVSISEDLWEWIKIHGAKNRLKQYEVVEQALRLLKGAADYAESR